MARTISFTLLASLLLPAVPAIAQVSELPEIVISASQFPLAAERVGASATVLSGEKLREDGMQTVAEALRTVPGLHLNHSGTRGTLTEVRMRGAEANHVLVLIDGIEVNSLTNNAFDFADFPVDDIERIEVIRGPQSGIYGSNAHAGVIAVITRSGRGLLHPRLDARIEGGMLDTRAGSFNLRGATGPAYGSVTASGYESGGYNVSRFGSERDGSHAFTGTAKAGVDFSEALNVEGVVRYTNRSVAGDPQDFMPGSPTFGLVVDGDQRTEFESLAARLGATLTLFDGRWVQSANAKLFDEKLTGLTDGLFVFGTDGKRTAFDYKSTVFFDTMFMGGERHTLSLLADKRREDFAASFFPGGKFVKQRKGLAGEYVLDLPTHTTLSAAARHDWNEPFENVTTWRLALSQRLPATHSRIHASIGKGITDPDHTEVLGFPGLFPIRPNPDLRPESSVGWDAGWEQQLWDGRLVTDVTYFSTEFTDKIEPTFIGFETLYVNAPGTAHRRGVETSMTLWLFDWLSLTGSYTYTDAKDSMGERELRRPPHSASFEATALFADGRGRATLGAVHNGGRRDIRFNDFPMPNSVVRLPGVTVLRAHISYDVSETATLYARAENLLGTRYEEIFSYRAAPFAAYAGLKVRLGKE